MLKDVKAYKVTNLSKVDKTLYKNGDLFYTNQSVAILINNQIKTFAKTIDLSDYVKRTEVQTMIDEAIANLGDD